MDDLTIELRKAEPVCLVRMSGVMVLADVPSVIATLARALTATRHRVAVCDVSGLVVPAQEYLLTAFPAALRRCGGWPSSSLHLAAPGTALAAALRHSRLQRYLPIHPDVTDAVRQAEMETLAEPSHLLLPPEPRSLALVRAAVRDLWPGSCRFGREEAVLVADELAANAIKHVAEPFTVGLALSASRALIAVSDPSRAEPLLREFPGGRGLHVVDRLSRHWGVRLVHAGGKTVWASLPPPVGSPTRAIPRSRGTVS